MIAGSLFSGVGGLDLGLTRAGYQHAFFAEADPWRRDVLAAHWPGVPVYDDVRAVAQPLPAGNEQPEWVDLLCGGFPCQDLSVAGKRRGLDGARSGLFFEFARIIQAVRPSWVLLENVPGLLSSNDGRDMGVVVGTLADLGYGVAWRVLDARFFGVPQRRRRVFIVCCAGGDSRSALRALCESCDGDLAAGECSWQDAPSRAGGSVAGAITSSVGQLDDQDTTRLVVSTLQAHKTGGYRIDAEGAAGNQLVVADTLTSGSHPASNAPGRRREDDSNLVAFLPTGGGAKGLSISDDVSPGTGTGTGGTVAITQAAGVRRLTPVECERLMSWPDGWTAPDGVKAPDSRRYAACGDGVVSNVAEWIGRRIMAAS